MFGNYSAANLNRQSSAGKNKAGKYPDRHFPTGKHKTGKAKTGNRIFPVMSGVAWAVKKGVAWVGCKYGQDLNRAALMQ